MDARLLEIGIEGVDEHEADGLAAMGGGEDTAVRATQGVSDEHERPPFAGRRKQRPEVGSRVDERVRRTRVAPPTTCPVVRTGPGGRCELVEDRTPRPAVAARSRFEDDGRRTVPAAVEVERPSADVDPLTGRHVRRRQAVSGEPGTRASGTGDIDDQGVGESDRDGATEGDHEPQPASPRIGLHRR